MHSFLRRPDGNVVVTLQFGDGKIPGNPGGLAEFTPDGKLVRTSSSRDSTMPGARIRTYSLEGVPALDRIVTTSQPMHSELTADVMQIWRLSDLRLLRTIAVPPIAGDAAYRNPFESRVLGDGKRVLMSTYNCGLYLLTGVDTPNPSLKLVHTFQGPRAFGCGVPVVSGHFWIMPIAYGHALISLDISDPAHPREVQRLPTEQTYYPHWLAADPGSNRIVLTDQGDGDPRVLMLRLDAKSGQLSWDTAFRDAGSARSGVSFDRASWSHGATGTAIPHAAIFRP